MKRLSREEFEGMKRDAVLLSRDKHGEKVLALADGRILKLFRHKRMFSSSRLRPYALRFKSNSQRLKTLDVDSPEVLEVYNCRDIKRHIVSYKSLDGDPLRERLSTGADRNLFMRKLAGFIALLHARGVYFRSLHLANVLVRPHGGFGLIDVSDMTISRKSLPPGKRARNFRQLLKYEEDTAALAAYGTDKFIEAYLDAAGLEPKDRSSFLRRLRRYRPDIALPRA